MVQYYPKDLSKHDDNHCSNSIAGGSCHLGTDTLLSRYIHHHHQFRISMSHHLY
jgi:hypothetical protein